MGEGRIKKNVISADVERAPGERLSDQHLEHAPQHRGEPRSRWF